MAVEGPFHPVDANGSPVDASFALEVNDEGFSLFFAARGGTIASPNARNTQYHVGLGLVLNRLKELNAVLTNLFLDSVKARRFPLEDRRLRLPDTVPLPLRLVEVDDVDDLRRKICEAQRNVLSEPGRNPKHGNRVRSIRVLFRLPEAGEPPTLADVAQFLVGDGDLRPTPDPEELERRVLKLRSRGRHQRPAGNLSPPSVDSPPSRRYLRLPAVVTYVLWRARSRCELCAKPPFLTEAGEVYLEVHHVHRLAEGGPDTPENAVALCPDCHRELHYGARRKDRVRELYVKVRELVPRTAGTR